MYEPRTLRSLPLVARALLLSACLLSAAAAAPSRVTLKLENVNAGQAAARLSEASGVPVEIGALRPIGAAPPQGSFDWEDVSFSRALRQLCDRFQLRPTRAGEGYRLLPAPIGVEPREPVGLFERGGVRLYVRSLNLYDSRWASFEPGAPPPQANRSLNLALTAELGEDEGDSIAGVQNLVVTDDQGHVATSKGETPWYFGSSNSGLYPDEWSGSVTLEGPHPEARKLVSIEGDLMRYRRRRTLQAELPLPLTGPVGRAEARDLIVLVSRYLVIPKPQDEGPEELPGPRVSGGELPSGPSVRVRLFAPSDRRYGGAKGGQIVPELVGKSGRRYPGSLLRGGSSYRGADVTVSDGTWIFPGCEEEPAKLTWEIAEMEEPVRLLRFRLADVPLPVPERFVARNAAPMPEGAAAQQNPYFQAGGGAVSSQVRIRTRSPRSGTVSLGLSRQTPGGWSAVRWIDLPVDFDGKVLLEDLQPGVYRVRRKYTGVELPKPGAWQNVEVTVTVAAGKTATLPPLTWAAPAPAAPKKPAPRR
ncbi:MAG: hypothetical protein ACK47B_02030 [Armatimonadota bacterium]